MKRGGLIVKILIIIAAIILLKVWFKIDVIKWLNSPEVKEFFFKIWDILQKIWNEYLKQAFETGKQYIEDFIHRFL